MQSPRCRQSAKYVRINLFYACCGLSCPIRSISVQLQVGLLLILHQKRMRMRARICPYNSQTSGLPVRNSHIYGTHSLYV